MRLSKLFGRTIKETPRDAELPSHRLLLRGGFMRSYGSGIYGLLPLGMRCVAKIERICKEEMNRIGGQEVRLPCLATRELWEESGRYATFGDDMIRLKDRHQKDHLLNPTHEEPVVFLARTEISSYRQLPQMVYQIQTKFRDEPRPRGGLIRLREFTMKDGYSFHTSEEDLQTYYDQVHAAYVRFYKRTGCKNFVSVFSDNGLFGGRYSHEFQMLTPVGEDKLLSCPQCRYSANEEIATSPFTHHHTRGESLEKVPTPGQTTIAALCTFLGIQPQQTAKAVMFQGMISKKPIVAFVRGDLDVIDKKVRSLVGEEVVPAAAEALHQAGAVAGSTGPLGLRLNDCTVVLDHTVMKGQGLVTGANEDGWHYQGFSAERDLLLNLSEQDRASIVIGDIAQVRAGDICPECGGILEETRGIEIGNIFHLGTKYSKSMGWTYLDESGQAQHAVMGCYGIGITRLLPAIIEESHDDRGPIFPLPIAPFEVHLCALNLNTTEVSAVAEALYHELLQAGCEVVFDDRDEKAGSQFADADLLGVPFRLVVSPRSLEKGGVEFVYRNKQKESQVVPQGEAVKKVMGEIQETYAYYNSL